ncbi:MAG: SemiSWEET transporter [Parvibaculaceae bacterium]|nr:SemiSWEET transporter [Parvibaculaceae bacterium]
MNIEILGSVAAVFTTLSFVPQAVKVVQDGNTEAISLGMYLMFTLGVCLWLAYGLLLESWPLIAANSVTLLLAGTILSLKMRHTLNPPAKREAD